MLPGLVRRPRLRWLLTAVVLLGGCVYYCAFFPGCVKRVVIDPKEVGSLLIGNISQEPTGLTVSDPEVIRVCVSDIDGLSFRPGRPFPGGSGSFFPLRFEFRDHQDRAIASFDFIDPGFFEVRVRHSSSFWIRYDPVPNIGRLLSYQEFLRLRDCIGRAVSEMRSNDSLDRFDSLVGSLIDCYPPAGVARPRTKDELAGFVTYLRRVTLKELLHFGDYFARWYPIKPQPEAKSD